ncbi:YqiJ family protein [Agarivorans sp. TSD2052]|uniref:OB-fold-containig protein n=1 Tax=Agarivorans sp. TSD2052 TaxID=2937286 RepID=UPI00200C0938|nr:OB-fold-containig protein [Agarivorans sp. TSD2052]UPW19499.1 YqiJ family protein [Agarivorans sp. TSD2052]
MYQFLLADINSSFTLALVFVLGLALVEILGSLVGLSLLNTLDDILPIDIDVDVDADVSGGTLSGVLGWLYLHQLPLLVWIILFLSSFGLAGLTLNYVSLSNGEWLLPSSVTHLGAVVFALLNARFLGRAIAKVFPKSQSSAVSKHGFKGLQARVTVGTATVGSPAEAVCTDQHGQKHYLMVQPLASNDSFPMGTEIVLLERHRKYWTASKLSELLNDHKG